MMNHTNKAGFFISYIDPGVRNREWEFAQLMIQREMVLTHCGLVTPYGVIELGQDWFR